MNLPKDEHDERVCLKREPEARRVLKQYQRGELSSEEREIVTRVSNCLEEEESQHETLFRKRVLSKHEIARDVLGNGNNRRYISNN